MPYFFISYQRKNKRFAKLLKKKLEQRLILCWIDENIPLGDEWKRVIDTEIQTSIGVIVIVTPEALKSQYVTYEWSYGMGLGKRIIPIILEYPDPNNPDHFKIHPKIDDRQNLDFSKPRKHPWIELIRKLQDILKQEDLPKNIREAEEEIHSFDGDRRKKGIEFLMNHPNPAVIEIFARAVQSESPDVALHASLALALKSNHTDERAIVGLEKGIKENSRELQNILNTLVRMNNDPAIECVQRSYHKAQLENAVNLQNHLIDCACEFSNRNIIPVLRMMVNKSDGLRSSIVGAFDKFADPETLPELLAIAARTDIYANSRAEVIRTIGKIGDPETADSIFAIANSLKHLHFQEDNTIFDAVIDAFKAMGGQRVIDLLSKWKNDSRFSERSQMMRQMIRDMEEEIR